MSTLLGKLKRGKIGSTEYEFDRDAEALKEAVVEDFASVSLQPLSRSGLTNDPAHDIVRKWRSLEGLAREVAVS